MATTFTKPAADFFAECTAMSVNVLDSTYHIEWNELDAAGDIQGHRVDDIPPEEAPPEVVAARSTLLAWGSTMAAQRAQAREDSYQTALSAKVAAIGAATGVATPVKP